MIVRKATMADLPDLVGCVVEFASVGYPDEVPDRDHIAQVVSGAIENPSSLVAVLQEDDGRLSGCYMGTAIQNMISGRAVSVEILFWVREGRRGHGAKLLSFAEAWADDMSCLQMFLSCPATSPRAAKYFEAKGYKLTECHYGKAL